MTFDRLEFRGLIRRTLERHCPAWWVSDAAIELLLGTCAVESNFGQYRRQIKGPAVGVFQMEPETFYWVRNYSRNDAPIMAGRDVADLEFDDELAIVAARARYRVIPVALPAADNLEALALYWKFGYNTISGRGTIGDFLTKYNRYVIGV